MKKLLPKTNRVRSPTGRSQNRTRRNLKATIATVARLVVGLLIVLLQERTKTKERQNSGKHHGKDERYR